MPGSHARRSCSTCTTGTRRSSKSCASPIFSPIDGQWSLSVATIRRWSATWNPALPSRTTTNWLIAVVELLRDEDARREIAERGYQAFAARDQAAILDRALADLEASRTVVAPQTTCASVRAWKGKTATRSFSCASANCSSTNLRPTGISGWPRSSAIPMMRGRCSFWPKPPWQLDDFADARKWYARRVEMAGIDEEVYWAMYRLAASMAELGEPWSDVQDAYLRAWEFRPSRAEALYAIAFRYRIEQRYQLGYEYAQRAADIPFPEDDLFVLGYFAEIYAWRATDEQATCAFWIGKHAEAFELCRRLLARPDLPEADRQRIAANRDFSVPAMIEAAAPYPDALAQSLAAGPGDADVTVSLIAGPDRQTTEQTMNSFLNCCLDVSRVGRFLVLDTGLSAPDRATLQQRYGFLKFADRARRQARRPARAAPRSDRRTVLAAPGRGLAVFRPRELHHPPDRGARRRTTGVSGGHQLRRRGQTHRRQRRRTSDTPGTRHRPLPPDRGDGHAARRCSTPHAWIGPSVCTTATPIRPPNVGDRPPAPGCAPPASTKCSASQVCTSRPNCPKRARSQYMSWLRWNFSCPRLLRHNLFDRYVEFGLGSTSIGASSAVDR